MYSYIQQAEYILTLIYYASVVDISFILREVSKYINRLGLSMSENGIFMKYGPMGFSSQQVTQRLVSVGVPEQRRIVRGRRPPEGVE